MTNKTQRWLYLLREIIVPNNLFFFFFQFYQQQAEIEHNNHNDLKITYNQ